MTVINPSSISGITSITMPSGDGNVLTIHTNDGTERFRIDSSGNVKVGSAVTISQDGDVFFTGVCTATTLAGSGANLTALPAANLTGALPAISGANLTGIAATDNVRTGILDVAGIATFRNDVNIGAAVTILRVRYRSDWCWNYSCKYKWWCSRWSKKSCNQRSYEYSSTRHIIYNFWLLFT